MATMNEFLRYLDEPEVRAGYKRLDDQWNSRARTLNQRLEQLALPVRVANMTSVWTTVYTQPSRYNWMFQYYIHAVEAFRFEEKVSDLPRPHRNDPPQKSGRKRIERNERVADQKARGAEQVQTLVHPTLMVKAMIVPALLFQLL
jgi:hypothetical protein